MLKKVILIGMIMCASSLTFSQVFYDSPHQEKWVDSVYNSLNKNERIGQLFIAEVQGDKITNEVVKLVEGNKLGGIYFSKITPSKQVELTNKYQNKIETPLLIGMNTKNGLNPDLPGTFDYPHPVTIKAVKDTFLLNKMIVHVQEQLAVLGANIHLSRANKNQLTTWNDELLYNLGANRLYINGDSIHSFLMISSNNINLAIKTIKKSIRKNSHLKSQFEKNIKEILKAKFQSCPIAKTTNPDNLELKLTNPKYEVLIEQLYINAINVKSKNLLPLNILDTNTFASISINGNAPHAKNYLSKYAFFTHYNEDEDYTALINKLSSYKVVVANIIEPSQLSADQIEFLQNLSNKTSLVNCYYGEVKADIIQDGNSIYAYENSPYAQKLVPQFIFGAISNSNKKINRLSYSIPESAEIDSYVLAKVDKIAYEAVETGATPGCQILIAKNGKVIFDKNYGYYTYDSLRPVTGETIYDLASITKVAATLQAMLFMVEKGLVDLDYKMSYYLTELKGTNKEDMIIRDILAHQAGLWPWLPFWKKTMDNEKHLPDFYSYHPQDNYPLNVANGLYSNAEMEEKVWQWVIESDLREKKERVPYDYKYSDMGFYMMYRLAEQLLNQPIEDFLSQNIYEPLGASTLNYLPLCKFPQSLIAPTENDNVFRKSLLIGTVHDQGAAMIGGIAGHAGLFSNANDLAKLFQMHLQNGNYGGQNYFKEQTLEQFRHPQYETTRRGAGWDKPIPGAWYGPTGENVSPATFGHTGFTGTAAWVDPEHELVYIFLSNRVYPNADNAKLYRTNIRTRIQDLIYQAIWSYHNKND